MSIAAIPLQTGYSTRQALFGPVVFACWLSSSGLSTVYLPWKQAKPSISSWRPL